MDYLNEFNNIMLAQKELALATSVGDQPNVRIVNFFYDTNRKGVAYFSTFRNNRKVKEMEGNDKVAFTTVPPKDTAHVRVFKGVVKKSDFTIFDLQQQFMEKIPDYGETIQEAGKHLVLYEIHFTRAKVTLDYHHSREVTL